MPNLKYRQDDKYWLRFLRVQKYDVKKAYHNVMAFLEQRRKYKNDYGIVPPESELKPFQELNWLTILPYTDEEGRIIFLMNFSKIFFFLIPDFIIIDINVVKTHTHT